MISVRRLVAAMLVVGMITTYSFAWGRCSGGCSASFNGNYGCGSSCNSFGNWSPCSSCGSSCSTCSGQGGSCSSCTDGTCTSTTSNIISQPKTISYQADTKAEILAEEKKIQKLEAMIEQMKSVIAQIKKERAMIAHPISYGIPANPNQYLNKQK